MGPAALPRGRPRDPRAGEGARHGAGDAAASARPAPPGLHRQRAGKLLRPESGIRTIVGVPCQDWDLDPDAPTVLPPGAPTVGAQILTHRVPAMEGATLARGYRAFDCYSRDRHAILGRVDGIDGLYLATAFSGSGFKIAPAVGVCVAELIVDGRAKTVDIEAFNLRRFAEGRSPEGPYPYAPRKDHAGPD
ncbi:MAG TPA: FAD-dependent oxidoreductase [Candidatus Binatia bacterium]|nr:FAD-dependent oxidoreductase [Candidatus Binatia bacterium]